MDLKYINILDLEEVLFPQSPSINIQLSNSSPVVFRLNCMDLIVEEYNSLKIKMIDIFGNTCKKCYVQISHIGVDSTAGIQVYTQSKISHDGVAEFQHYKGHTNTINITSDYYEDFTYIMNGTQSLAPMIELTFTLSYRVNMLQIDDNYIRYKDDWLSVSGVQKEIIESDFYYSENLIESSCYGSVIYNDNIYGIPSKGKYLLKYDINTKQTQQIDVGASTSGSNKWNCGAVISNYLYCIPYRSNQILKVNLDTNTYSYFGDFLSRSKEWSSCVIIGSFIYAIPSLDSSILRINTLTDEIAYFGNFELIDKWSSCQVYNNKIYAIPSSGTNFMIYNLSNYTYEFIDINESGGTKWLSSTIMDNKIYSMPYDSRNILEFNLIDNSYTLIDTGDTSSNKWISTLAYKNNIFGVPGSSNKIIRYNPDSNNISIKPKFDGFKWNSSILYDNKIISMPNENNILEFSLIQKIPLIDFIPSYTKTNNLMEVQYYYDNNIQITPNTINHSTGGLGTVLQTTGLIAKTNINSYLKINKYELFEVSESNVITFDFLLHSKDWSNLGLNKNKILLRKSDEIQESNFDYNLYLYKNTSNTLTISFDAYNSDNISKNVSTIIDISPLMEIKIVAVIDCVNKYISLIINNIFYKTPLVSVARNLYNTISILGSAHFNITDSKCITEAYLKRFKMYNFDYYNTSFYNGGDYIKTDNIRINPLPKYSTETNKSVYISTYNFDKFSLTGNTIDSISSEL